jgi:hypothetical protein
MATFELRSCRHTFNREPVADEQNIGEGSTKRSVFRAKKKSASKNSTDTFLRNLEAERVSWSNKPLFQPAFSKSREFDDIKSQFTSYIDLIRTDQTDDGVENTDSPFEILLTLNALDVAIAKLTESDMSTNKEVYMEIKEVANTFVENAQARVTKLKLEAQVAAEFEVEKSNIFTLTEIDQFEETLDKIRRLPSAEALIKKVEPDANWNKILKSAKVESDFTEHIHANTDLGEDVLPHLFQRYYLPNLAKLVDMNPDEDFPTDTLLSLKFLAGSTARVHRLFARVRDDTDQLPRGLKLAYETLIIRKNRVFGGNIMTDSARRESEELDLLLAIAELPEETEVNQQDVFVGAVEAGRVQMLVRLRILVDALNDEEKRGNLRVNQAIHAHLRFIAQKNPNLVDGYMMTAISSFLTPYCLAFDLADIDAKEQLKAFRLTLDHMAPCLLQFEIPLDFVDFTDKTKQEEWFNAISGLIKANNETLRLRQPSQKATDTHLDLRTVLPKEIQAELDMLVITRVAPSGAFSGLSTTLLDGLSACASFMTSDGVECAVNVFKNVLGDMLEVLSAERVALAFVAAGGVYFVTSRIFNQTQYDVAAVSTVAAAVAVGTITTVGVWWQLPFLGRDFDTDFQELTSQQMPLRIIELVHGYVAGTILTIPFLLVAAVDRLGFGVVQLEAFRVGQILPLFMGILAAIDIFTNQPHKQISPIAHNIAGKNRYREYVFKKNAKKLLRSFVPELNLAFATRGIFYSTGAIVKWILSIIGKTASMMFKAIKTPFGVVALNTSIMTTILGFAGTIVIKDKLINVVLKGFRKLMFDFLEIFDLGSVGTKFAHYLIDYMKRTSWPVQLLTIGLIAKGIFDVEIKYKIGNKGKTMVRTAAILLQFALSSYIFQQDGNTRGGITLITPFKEASMRIEGIVSPLRANLAVFALIAGTFGFLYEGRLRRFARLG